jgi:PAS domain S-box-containing protein
MKTAYQGLQSLFDHASDLIQVTALDGAVLYTNRTWQKVLGYQPADAGALSFLEILHPEDCDRFQHCCHELKTKGGDRPMTLHLKTKIGQWLTVQGQLHCLLKDLEEPQFWSLWRVVNSEPSHFQAEEGVLQRVVDSLPSCISMKDVQGRLLLSNQAMAELYSTTTEKILGKRLTEFQSHLSSEQLQAYQEEDLAVLKTGQSLVKEDCIPLPNGQSRWYQTLLKPFISDQGEVQGVLVNSLEISDRKLAEQKLLQREHYLATLVEVQRYLLEYDSSGAMRSAHQPEVCYPTILKILGEASESSRAYLFESHTGPSGKLLISQRAEWCAPGISSEINNPHLQNVVLEQFPFLSQTFQSGQVMSAIVTDLPEPERQALQTQGVLSILNLPLMVDDEFFGIIGFDDCVEARVWDSSEIDFLQAAAAAIALFIQGQRAETIRQQAETALRQSQERLRTVIAAAPIILFAIDNQGRFILSEGKGLERLSLSPGEVVGQSVFEMYHDIPAIVENISRGLAGETGNYVVTVSGVTYESQYSPLFDEQGNQIGITAISVDITERQQAEMKIFEALQREKELNELRSNFVTTVSHDFRTPLTVIQSASELLQYNDWDSQERLEFLTQIRTAVQHMTHLLEDVLLIGQIESGNIHFKPSSLDLHGFCASIIGELQMAYGRDCHFQLTVHGLPFPLLLDQKLIRQILTNLLSNAAKYSPPGCTVELHVTYASNQIILQIQDQGIGIPRSDKEALFKAFHRASNVGNIEGTGLGLAIVKHCVDLHQGQITVHSEMGVGSTFTVTLPVQQGEH